MKIIINMMIIIIIIIFSQWHRAFWYYRVFYLSNWRTTRLLSSESCLSTHFGLNLLF
jgi:hypothetical protein